MNPIVSIKKLTKTYSDGFTALDSVSLDIHEGEIFSLLGPNGAGKTTLIGVVSGLVTKTSGTVTVLGKDIVTDYRFTRGVIGLVPQEIQLDIFLSVRKNLEYMRGFYGKPKNPTLIERILRSLSLWEKRDAPVMALSGGMKRRVLIGKALTNEPKILFLDEPTAGVDVELRKGMWELIAKLKEEGTTIILTTHYLEEAEKMADRIGIINKGKIILVDEKQHILDKLSHKEIRFYLSQPLETLNTLPDDLTNDPRITLDASKQILTFTKSREESLPEIMKHLGCAGIRVVDINTQQQSLEEIFVGIINKQNGKTEPTKENEENKER